MWVKQKMAVPARTGAPRVEDQPPTWIVALHGDDPDRRRVGESILTVADGRFGTRGSREEDGRGTDPLVLAAGVYHRPEEADVPELLPGPLWTSVLFEAVDTDAEERSLDLRTGILTRTGPDGLRTERFASVARPGICALRVSLQDATLTDPSRLRPPHDHVEGQWGRGPGGIEWMRTLGEPGDIAAAAITRTARHNDRVTVERIAAFQRAASGHGCSPDEVVGDLQVASEVGFEGLRVEHIAAWATRWEGAQVDIDGDPEMERAVRFALFHLMASVADEGEAAVGARGISGRAYAGHVFWDADVYVLPFLAATHPRAARAMLEYRIRRLPPARRAAAKEGSEGARFPWESANDGSDVTPRKVRFADGSVGPILTGPHEEHIVADVAWAADHYVRWSGDEAFLAGAGRPLILETARYWASRIRPDADGRGHLYGVIGPDEYHGPVDDNAFTNVMARWNLRRGADLLGDGPTARHWRELAHGLVDGYDPAIGMYEQFAGFHDLEELLVAEFAEPPVAADILLGRERLERTQIIKQPDVLMLHHLVPDEVAQGSLLSNLTYYLPRTSHGSSLSPGITAALLARAGRPDEAMDHFRIAAMMDLDDLTETTAGGLHLAAMGSVWQAVTYGFAGVWPGDDGLHLDPRLPSTWERLRLRVRYGGTAVRLDLGHDEILVDAAGDIPIRLSGGPPVHVRSGRFVRRGGGWKEARP